MPADEPNRPPIPPQKFGPRAPWLIERARKKRLARIEAEKLNPTPKPPRKARAESEWERRRFCREFFGAAVYADQQSRNAIRDGKASPLPPASRRDASRPSPAPDAPEGSTS